VYVNGYVHARVHAYIHADCRCIESSEACMNAVNAVLSCKAGWDQYFVFPYTLKLLSFHVVFCYGAS